jgi:hypothetical protein
VKLSDAANHQGREAEEVSREEARAPKSVTANVNLRDLDVIDNMNGPSETRITKV